MAKSSRLRQMLEQSARHKADPGFGDQHDARFLTARDQLEYARARERGGIRIPGRPPTQPVRKQSVEAVLLVLLNADVVVGLHGAAGARWAVARAKPARGHPT